MKIIHVQTVMDEEMLKELKRLTGYETTKDALYTAVEYFIKRKNKSKSKSKNKSKSKSKTNDKSNGNGNDNDNDNDKDNIVKVVSVSYTPSDNSCILN